MIWPGNHLKLRIMLREIAGRAMRCGHACPSACLLCNVSAQRAYDISSVWEPSLELADGVQPSTDLDLGPTDYRSLQSSRRKRLSWGNSHGVVSHRQITCQHTLHSKDWRHTQP